MTDMIENKTFDEIQVGDRASLTRALDQEGIEALAVITGNLNLIDLDPGPADTSMFGQGGGQTGWAATLFATLAGTRLPGLGSIARHIDVRLHRAVAVGVPVIATVTVAEKRPETGVVVLDCRATDPTGAEIATGLAEVIAAKVKMRYPVRDLPKVQVRHEDRYLELLRACEGLPALGCAVVHPCSADALLGAVEAAERHLIAPILVGPEGKIRALAERENLDISPYRLVSTEHSHQSAEVAVSLVLAGEAQTLMKGSLHTDELLAEVVK
ncbi:MAG: enoyl-CoA hydratase, partial [Candidatus Competibacter sp.]|nr:enoyl-CoA hydratase [Candidatus Competibacter sp.]